MVERCHFRMVERFQMVEHCHFQMVEHFQRSLPPISMAAQSC
jgi:hypothetical protein